MTAVDVAARYAVWNGVGEPITIEERLVTVAVPPGGALLAVELATVCGSDVHTASGHRPGPVPSILGHEQVGRVVAVDPEAPPTAVDGRALTGGERVVWSVAASCGRCDRCTAGMPQKCHFLRKYGHEALDPDWPLNGGFGTHCVILPGTPMVVVPETMPAGVAAPATCATATVAAALDAARRPLDGARVLVTGAGMLGVTAVAMATAAGAAVTVSDPDAGRRATALCYGARTAVAPGEPIGLVDIAIELSGHPDAVESVVGALDVGGVAVLVGAVSAMRPVTIDPERIVRGLQRIVGVHNYRPEHLQRAVDFLAATTLPFAELVGEPAPLDELENALTVPPPSRFLRRAIDPNRAAAVQRSGGMEG